ncbi:AraC family transcriptional regulator [Streptacidiphilus sp. PB12-B1b]|uniref:AraC family transcriptional regulator n=1 Tax=Streptacidiphilus sp. PB12-B1b TaxID=2705012 RepID=UPI0015F92BBD|nr:AraC family transcriptional regulator [Streptacidiphilus sp. PB12-B1b]QMU76999.1 AraC family transcriptional regulator [Streptacidiphilus sp. PB12-B1b]
MTATLGEGDPPADPARSGAAWLPRTVAVHHVRAALRGAERRGVPVGPLLERAAIAPELLDAGRARVSPEQFARLVQQLWTALDDELLGMAPAPSRVGTFAMMCRVAVHDPDLRSALRTAADFYALFPSGPGFRLVEPERGACAGPAEARIEFDLPAFEDPDRFGSETLLVVGHRFAAWLIRRRIDLLRVELAYPAPAHALEYDLLFGAPSVFDAPRTSAVFAAGLLDEPVLRDAADLDAFLRRAPIDVLARANYGSTVAARVRRLLGQALPGSMPEPERIAARLSVSPQTLRRQLAAEGTTFHRIRDQLRRDHAVVVLAGGTTSIEQLSEQLGFSEPSAFHRAFRRWTGSTPRAYQRGRAAAG